MIPKEVLKQIRRIQINTSRAVNDVFAGQYHSIFKGRGMEFDEVREYVPGDDVRSIDWNVTARAGHPYIKKFVEERELTVMLLLDLSASTMFGTSEKLKRTVAAEICAVLAFAALKNNDKVGFIGFTDEVELYVPPQKGLKHVMRLVREALYFKPKGKKTNINGALEYLNKITTRKTVAFLLSDFFDEGYERALSIANRKHDLTAITVQDPIEYAMPSVGIVSFIDLETGKRTLVDTKDSGFRSEFQSGAEMLRVNRNRMFSKAGVDAISIRADEGYANALFRFFKMRERRR